MSTTTWRYVRRPWRCWRPRAEVRKALRDAVKTGTSSSVLDGTLVPIDQVAADRPFFSGKHRHHGMNLQVIASPAGSIVWVSGALPGTVHDMKAAWIWGIEDELATADSWACDKAYQVPRTPELPTADRANPNRRNRPTAPTRNSAAPEKGQTHSSKPGRSSTGYAAALGAPGLSPKIRRSQIHETEAGRKAQWYRSMFERAAAGPPLLAPGIGRAAPSGARQDRRVQFSIREISKRCPETVRRRPAKVRSHWRLCLSSACVASKWPAWNHCTAS